MMEQFSLNITGKACLTNVYTAMLLQEASGPRMITLARRGLISANKLVQKKGREKKKEWRKERVRQRKFFFPLLPSIQCW